MFLFDKRKKEIRPILETIYILMSKKNDEKFHIVLINFFQSNSIFRPTSVGHYPELLNEALDVGRNIKLNKLTKKFRVILFLIISL